MLVPQFLSQFLLQFVHMTSCELQNCELTTFTQPRLSTGKARIVFLRFSLLFNVCHTVVKHFMRNGQPRVTV